MCTGAEIGLLGVGTSALGTLSSANAARANASMQQTQLNFNAQMARVNEQLNETNAQATLLAGQREEMSVRLRTGQLKSRQRASMAANGIDLSSTTPVAILSSTDMMGDIDAQTVASNALRAAWGYRTQGTNEAAKAAMASAGADSINPNAVFTSTLLGGAGNVAMNWYSVNKGVGATKWGTTAGSQQSRMLAAQEAGF